jgi:hypothetical protein
LLPPSDRTVSQPNCRAVAPRADTEQPAPTCELGAGFRARSYTETAPGAHSSAGRATRWQRVGRRFEPGWVHLRSPRKRASLVQELRSRSTSRRGRRITLEDDSTAARDIHGWPRALGLSVGAKDKGRGAAPQWRPALLHRQSDGGRTTAPPFARCTTSGSMRSDR